MKYEGYQRDRVACPFNPDNHWVPRIRLPWHLAKCPEALKHKADGKPIFHCRFNANHIFLDEEKFREHELECTEDLQLTEKCKREASRHDWLQRRQALEQYE